MWNFVMSTDLFSGNGGEFPFKTRNRTQSYHTASKISTYTYNLFACVSN